MTRRWRVLLCGYYGMGNRGDELLLASSLALLRRCGVPDASIAVLSGDPAATSREHHVDSVDRWSPSSVLKAVAQSETLLLGGGGIFQDSSSARSPLYYWLVVRAASLLGCRPWAVGQSVGPLSRKMNVFLARNAFAACRAVSVRDTVSADFLRSALLTDDLVLSLPESAVARVPEYFLVNFRPTADGLEYRAAAAARAYAEANGLKTVAIAMDDADARLMERMTVEKLFAPEEILTPAPREIERYFARGAIAFGMRLHFGVFCLRSGVPCTLVPYDPKVSAFAERWGASLWTDGALKKPEAWQHGTEVAAAREKIQKDFIECFQKVMSS